MKSTLSGCNSIASTHLVQQSTPADADPLVARVEHIVQQALAKKFFTSDVARREWEASYFMLVYSMLEKKKGLPEVSFHVLSAPPV